MSYGPKQVFKGGVIPSAASTGTYIDMSDKTFTKLAIQFPSMSTGAMLTVYGCDTAAGTYLPVFERAATAKWLSYKTLMTISAAVLMFLVIWLGFKTWKEYDAS